MIQWMKALLVTVMLAASLMQAKAQDSVTDTLLVYGNCGMCQKRIEAAAAGKGVQKASWDMMTGRLIVTYQLGKTNLQAIEERILAAGHDTESRRAEDKVYQRLHHCCQYERRQE